MKTFQVTAIDHVEIFVPDQFKAAEWYQSVLGLAILRDYEFWAGDGGPLMISSDNGATMVALFDGEPQGADKSSGIRRIAFRVDAENFKLFLTHAIESGVYNSKGKKLTKLKVIDHQKSWSVYFADPWGTLLEVTTYEYEAIT